MLSKPTLNNITGSATLPVRLHLLLYYGAFSFLVLFTILFNHEGLTYDEPYYLHNVELLNKYGLSAQFLTEMGGPAGPLHAVIHWVLEPITGMNVIATRMVNIFFLAGTIWCLFLSLRRLQTENAHAVSLCIMAVPMVFVCSGMALTELPALFFLSAALLCLVIAWQESKYLYAMLGGILMSLAILGRQPYLVVLIALPVLLYRNYSNGKLGLLFLFGLFSIILPAFIFRIWGGIVPHTGGDVATRKFISFFNLFISLGYAFLLSVFICPAWLVPVKKRLWFIYLFAFIIIVAVCYYFKFTLPVMNTVSQRVLPASLIPLYGNCMAGVLIFVGLYFLYSSIVRFFGNTGVPLQLFFITACALLLLSNMKVTHQFSSRYVFQAAPFFIIMFAGGIRFNFQMLSLRIVAVLIGIVSLLSYFK